MVMTREQKVARATEVRDRIDRAVSMVFVDYGGVTVELITDLRNRFRAAGVEYQVVKNNVVRKALEGHPLGETSALDDHLKGMTGIAWTYEDPSAAAKIIKAFRKEGDAYEKLEVKCGVIDNEVLDAAQVENTLATLPGKNEVRSMLLAQLLAPAESLVRQLNAPGQNLAYALDAYERKQSEGA
jgi:large subunit ribosomal protein L10